jgi:ABC-type bacteriocin/lantibiotic exporter with double-glycine peptidase domain
VFGEDSMFEIILSTVLITYPRLFMFLIVFAVIIIIINQIFHERTQKFYKDLLEEKYERRIEDLERKIEELEKQSLKNK